MKRLIVFVFIIILFFSIAHSAFISYGVNSGAVAIPAGRLTVWQPGVTYNAIPASGSAGNTVPSTYTGAGYGIPTNRTQCGSTLTPVGSGSDTAQIIAAMNACTAGHFVLLSCGVFNILTPINYNLGQSGYITLRGCGPGKGLSTGKSAVAGTGVFNTDGTATQLYYGNSTAGFSPVVSIGSDATNPGVMVPLASDMVFGSYTATLTGSAGLSVGNIVRIDQNTDSDPDVVWGPNHCSAGAQFLGNIVGGSGSVLNVSSVISGTVMTTSGSGQGNITLEVTGIGRGAAQITTQASGTTGGVGTYNLNSSQTLAGTNLYMSAGCPSRAYFTRQDRSFEQLFEVASIAGGGTILTFTTPAHHTYCAGSGSCTTTPGVTSGEAQLTTLSSTAPGVLYAVGVEEMQISFGTGNGNLIFSGCAYCWAKHVESYWSIGASVLLDNCFRCELRDSFIHETPQPVQGGAGYLIDYQFGTSDSLVENTISWFGDKNMVGQSTGGGNVFAYNYTADAFEYTFPSLPESGLNFAHNTTSHMELIEGNESHQFSGDSYWGNSIDITVFRNNLTDLRPAYAPLATFVAGSGCPYIDDGQRAAVQINANAFRQNVVGNIIGQNGQALLSFGSPCMFVQNGFSYEDITALGNGQTVYDWYIGEIQSGVNSWDATTYLTQLRQGNWSWALNAQTWYASPIGATGSTSTGSAVGLVNSYYLKSTPAFLSSSMYCPCSWPWVNPSNGTTTTLPAKSRFINGVANGYNAL